MEVISVNDYASAFRRLLAFIIDQIFISAVLSVTLFKWWGSPVWMDWGGHMAHFRFWGHGFWIEAASILYFAFMESSKYQATLGKIVMGIKVTSERFQPISFSKALLRNLSKILSWALLCIGYIMIIFDDRKQGLHDKIADTLVVKQ